VRFWESLFAGVLCGLALVVLLVLGRRADPFLRRLPPRLALALAVALSYVPATRAQEGQPPVAAEASRVAAYGELGAIWRAMSDHASRRVQDAAAYGALRERLRTALALAQPREELQVLFNQRYEHILWSVYPPAMCYGEPPFVDPVMLSRNDVEEQVAALDRLREAGEVPAEALDRARARLAMDIEVFLQAGASGPGGPAGGPGPAAVPAVLSGSQLDELGRRYLDGQVQASPAATKLAADVVALTAQGTDLPIDPPDTSTADGPAAPGPGG